eukprot:5950329-Heterocapsa_arctica.AAC.1
MAMSCLTLLSPGISAYSSAGALKSPCWTASRVLLHTHSCVMAYLCEGWAHAQPPRLSKNHPGAKSLG